MNFSKYREQDTIQLVGLCADVFKENEQGELIDSICCKDASWITQKAIFGKSENFNFEKYVLECLNQVCYPELKAADIAICGNCLIFWMRENEDGYFDEDGKYDVEYSVSLEINGKTIEEDDLVELCPNFEY